MDFKKIAGPLRIDGPGSAGQPTEYRLVPRSGGRNAKVAQYMIKVIAESHSAAKIGLRLEHGPDGIVSAPAATPIANAVVASVPGLLVGDTGAVILGEYLHVVLTCISNDTTACWLNVEVYELRKPF